MYDLNHYVPYILIEIKDNIINMMKIYQNQKIKFYVMYIGYHKKF